MPKAFAWILAAVTVLVLALFGLAIGVAADDAGSTLRRARHRPRRRHRLGPRRRPRPSRAGARARAGRRPRAAGARSAATRGAPSLAPTRRSACRRGSSRGRAGSAATSSSRPSTARASCTSTGSPARRSRSTRRRDEIRWTAPRRRDAPVEPRDRRAARARRLTGRNRHRALDRRSGRLLWQVRTAGKVESSPVVVDGTVVLRLARRSRVRGSIASPGGFAGRTRPADASTRARRCSAGRCA